MRKLLHETSGCIPENANDPQWQSDRLDIVGHDDVAALKGMHWGVTSHAGISITAIGQMIETIVKHIQLSSIVQNHSCCWSNKISCTDTHNNLALLLPLTFGMLVCWLSLHCWSWDGTLLLGFAGLVLMCWICDGWGMKDEQENDNVCSVGLHRIVYHVGKQCDSGDP